MKNKFWHFIYNILYRLHLVYCFFARPKVKGAYIICLYEQKVLIIKNSYKTYYTIPCGKVDKGESALEAAKRELKEEVNLDFPLSNFTFIEKFINETEYKYDQQYYYLINLDANDLSQIKVDGIEVVEAELYTKNDINKLNVFPPVKRVLCEKILTG